MHELSIAQSIVEIIQQHISESDWERVEAVRLKIGAFAGVVPDSLEFSFQAITAESSLNHARLEIESFHFVFIVMHAIQQEKTKLDWRCAGCVEAEIQKFYRG